MNGRLVKTIFEQPIEGKGQRAEGKGQRAKGKAPGSWLLAPCSWLLARLDPCLYLHKRGVSFCRLTGETLTFFFSSSPFATFNLLEYIETNTNFCLHWINDIFCIFPVRKKAGVLVEVNGKEYKVTAKEITENFIKFVHKGEMLTFTFRNRYLLKNVPVKHFI